VPAILLAPVLLLALVAPAPAALLESCPASPSAG
jgi:hypothetical protein